MNILTMEQVSKNFGLRNLFADVSLGLEDTDKVGLIGVNGAGKSTFLSLAAGRENSDTGQITYKSGLQVGWLSQEPEFEPERTVLEEIFAGEAPIMQVLRRYRQSLYRLELAPQNPEAQQQLLLASQEMDVLQAWQAESQAKTILTKLGIEEFGAAMGTLSGGQRKRVALAAVLVAPVDLLILDEPTNHLDPQAVLWLEQYLTVRSGALLLITHDRYFLDAVADRILELDRGKIYSYTGNYSAFLEAKAVREELEEGAERKRRNLYRAELAWMRRGARARSTKQKARVDRFRDLAEKAGAQAQEQVQITAAASRLGRKIIEMKEMGYQVEGRELLKDFTYHLVRGDRIGVVGNNGSGKTTFLRLMAGEIKPSSGQVEIGQTVKLGFFAQQMPELDERLRVIDYIREEARFITAEDGTSLGAAQMLEQFLFPPAMHGVLLSKLSGGEKRRLYLLRLLMGAPNVLLLDEPTNDLDIPTLAVLENYLDTFPGAVVAVSHDRYFLDRMAEKIFALAGNGQIRQYPGGYSDYLQRTQEKEQNKCPETGKPVNKQGGRQREVRRKLSFQEEREYAHMEENIRQVELELAQLDKALTAAGSDFVLLQELTERQQMLQKQLDTLLERWLYLQELAEEMRSE